MKSFLKLKQIDKKFFGYEDIARIFNISLDSARVESSRFVKYGLIVRIKRNLYVLNDNLSHFTIEELFSLSNLLQVPSYVSLISALSYYGITTQIQQGFFECICTKRTKEVHVKDFVFNYTKIKKDLYFGFIKKHNFFIAEPEKAFLDAVYLSTIGRYSFDRTSIDTKKLNHNKLKKILKRFPNKVKSEIHKYGFA